MQYNKNIDIYDTTNDDDNDNEEQNNNSLDRNWDARKASANAIDTISNVLGSLQYDSYTPLRKSLEYAIVYTEDWKVIEAGILVLGAISIGCINSIIKDIYKSDVLSYIPKILTCAQQKTLPQLSWTSCWTLGKCAHIVIDDTTCTETEMQQKKEYLKPLITTLCQSTETPHLIIQSASASAISTIYSCKHSHKQLESYLDIVCKAAINAIHIMRPRNYSYIIDMVYNIISFLADHSIKLPFDELFAALIQFYQVCQYDIIIIIILIYIYIHRKLRLMILQQQIQYA